jgi:hypothetical protein
MGAVRLARSLNWFKAAFLLCFKYLQTRSSKRNGFGSHVYPANFPTIEQGSNIKTSNWVLAITIKIVKIATQGIISFFGATMLDAFIDDIMSSLPGKFLAINLHDAVANGLLDKDDYREFIRYWHDLAKSSGGGRPEDFLSVALGRVEHGEAIYRLIGNISPEISCTQLATTVDAAYLHRSVAPRWQSSYRDIFDHIADFDGTASISDLISYEATLFDILRGIFIPRCIRFFGD